jgi:formamidopyrimidine-DNA glycosylase
MPELPEVETVARGLKAQLCGRTLGNVHLMRSDTVHGEPGPLCAMIRGRTVRRVHRRGKRVVIELTGGCELIIHLGMSGQLTVVPAGAPVGTHTHLRIVIPAADRELRYRDPRRFGGVWLLAGGPTHIGRRLSSLGREPLELTLPEFRSLLRRRRQIKALLLDQSVISGLGNIYCDEALYRARIHPLASADRLRIDRVRGLLQAIRRVLRSAIRARGSSVRDYRDAGGAEGGYQRQHQVYGREGRPCPRCRTGIVRILVAGRSTHICPRCQQRRTRPAAT